MHAGTDFERELLASAARDAGSKKSFARTAAALGLATTAGRAAAASGTASAAAGIAGSAASAGTGGVAVLVKWVGLAAFVATGAGVAGAVSTTSLYPASPRQEAARATVATVATAARPVDPPVARAVDPVPAPAVASIAPLAIAPKPAPKPATAPAETRETRDMRGSTLMSEVDALDGVRRSLAQGDARGALHQLDDYARTFADPDLGIEASVLRVDATLAGGDRAQAISFARQLLADHPSSPHAAHLRHIVESANL